MPTSSPLLRISTKMLSERDFLSAFREGFARPILMLDVIDHSSGRPYIEVSFMPLGPVAVGFGDVSHFNRVFRRRFGETPSGVRAAAIGPEQK